MKRKKWSKAGREHIEKIDLTPETQAKKVYDLLTQTSWWNKEERQKKIASTINHKNQNLLTAVWMEVSW